MTRGRGTPCGRSAPALSVQDTPYVDLVSRRVLDTQREGKAGTTKGRPERDGPSRESVRQLLPRMIAIMRKISTYSHTTVTMMPKAPTHA